MSAAPVNPLIEIHGELLALRILVQRLLGETALRSGVDPTTFARAEHSQASAELSTARLLGDDEGSADAIRSEAQNVLDDVFSVVATTRGRDAGEKGPTG